MFLVVTPTTIIIAIAIATTTPTTPTSITITTTIIILTVVAVIKPLILYLFPNDIVGALIGKRGSRIDGVRKVSGAMIAIRSNRR